MRAQLSVREFSRIPSRSFPQFNQANLANPGHFFLSRPERSLRLNSANTFANERFPLWMCW